MPLQGKVARVPPIPWACRPASAHMARQTLLGALQVTQLVAVYMPPFFGLLVMEVLFRCAWHIPPASPAGTRSTATASHLHTA